MRDYTKAPIDPNDVELSLRLTLSLIDTMCRSFLTVNRDKVWNEDVKKALSEHSAARDHCQNYAQLSDLICIVEDRVEEAANWLVEMEEAATKGRKAD